MSQICITRAHGLSPKKARQAAEAVAAALQSEYGLQYLWEDDDTLTFQRTGISGQLTLERKQVTVNVRLGLLLLPLRASFEREIHAYFDQRFAARKA